MKRIFIAVRIEPEKSLLAMISEFKKSLKNDIIKWTELSNIHITILFLGDTPMNRVNEIESVLNKLCNGFGTFDLILKGAGVFRSINDPRVIWAGISHSEEMAELNRVIFDSLRATGTDLEQRVFNPHLTLGRIKKIKDIAALKLSINRYMDFEIQRVKVSEIILYESILRPEGPMYIPIGKYSL